MRPNESDTGELRAAMEAFDASMARGDAEALRDLLAGDAELYWHHQPTIVGRSAIFDAFSALFAAVDSSAWEPHHHTVEVHRDGAYVLSDFTESLVPRDGSPGRRVSGRAVFFWRREAEEWLITRMLSARSAPDTELS